MVYERKIRYLNYLSNGERVQGGGFVKLEVKNAGLLMELTVMGLYRTDSLEREVMLCGDGREKSIGRISISNGRGQFRYECHNLEDLGGTGIRYEELQGIRIPLGAGREISGNWEQRRGSIREIAGSAGRQVDDSLILTGDGSAAAEGSLVLANDMSDAAGDVRRKVSGNAKQGRVDDVSGRKEERMISEGSAETLERDGKEVSKRGVRKSPRVQETPSGREAPRRWEASSVQEAPSRREVSRGRETPDVREASGKEVRGASSDSGAERKTSATKPIRLLDDKWQQLCALYPRIRPFQDEREYLSIGPADFVLFPSDSYKMVNNSFLLHGYYNYKHLLLARMERKGEISYYIGAPGNYFEKEKQVAIMFGFESFECAQEPAQPGDFGYYMMRVQL